jgi:hypothetical protein
MPPPTLRLGQLRDAESRFARHVEQFFQSVHPAEKRYIEFTCRSWARDWGAMLPGLAPPAGTGFGQLVNECVQAHWRAEYARHRDARLSYQNALYQPRPKQLGTCAECGREFLKPLSTSKFCSHKCSREHRRLLYVHSPQTVACTWCKAPFLQKRKSHTFCSRLCWIDAQRTTRRTDG